ncbi:MAG: UTP--glucose-1-phosphate uridylyltransferase [Gammaproteobacteria bacterium]|jgi:UTP--glucose-1-phosphate uridylyltransferase
MIHQVRKAVFPVAGLGTRFLPATKASPKEMLPVVDKPIIQYAVEEALEAGITDLIFITGRTKRAIEDHFDRSPELEFVLAQRGREELLDSVRSMLPADVNCVYIRQAEPLGLGHAVACARSVVGDEAFAVVLPDDLIHHPARGCLSQMVDAFDQSCAAMLAVQDVPLESTDRYGIVDSMHSFRQRSRIRAIIEKPAPKESPGTLAVVGRYLLTPTIFMHLQNTPRGAGGEIQLTDAIARLLHDGPVEAFRFEGRRFDCGSKLGFLEATVSLALERDDLKEPFRALLNTLR